MSFFSFSSLFRTVATVVIALALPLLSRPALAAQPQAQPTIAGQLESIEISQRGETTDLLLHLQGGQLSAGARQGKEGQILVQLGNYLPGPQVQDLAVDEGLISKIEVRPKYRGKRPITVIVVTTRQPVTFAIDPGDGQVRVRLQQLASPVAKPAPTPLRTVQPPAPLRPRPQESQPSTSPRREVAAPAPLRPRPVSTPPPKPSPQPTPKRTEPTKPALPDINVLINMAQAWAHAWSRRSVEDYLSFYARDFQPAHGLSREQWQARRRRQLASPNFVEVALSDFRTSILDADRATVRFVQDYRSDTHQDRGFKTLDLIRQDGSWKILRETWVAADS